MKAAELALTSEQRATLRSWMAAGKTEQRVAFRAQIILAVAEGLSNKAAAARLATRPATVSKWRGRFARYGLAGVADAPRSGKPRHYEAEHRRRIIDGVGRAAAGRLRTLERPPAGQASGRYLQASDLAGAAGARDLAGAAAQLVHQYRSGVRAEGRRRRRALPAASGECRGVVGG